MLIDVAISGDRNVIKKEAENILKYKYLKINRAHIASLFLTDCTAIISFSPALMFRIYHLFEFLKMHTYIRKLYSVK